MSIRVDTASLIPGAIVCGNRGLGVLGSSVPSGGDAGAGYLYNDLSLPADADKEVRGLIITPPASGTLYAYEDSSFIFTGADGDYSFVYRLFVDGVDTDTETAYINIGAGAVTGVAAWTEADDTASVSGALEAAGTAAWTDADDAAALTGAVTDAEISGAIGIAEESDVVAATGVVTQPVTGTAGWTEESDAASVAGTVVQPVTGAAGWTEANDSIVIAGTSAVTDEDEQYPLAGLSQSYPLAGQRQTYPLGN